MNQLDSSAAKRPVLPGYHLGQQIYESATSLVYRAVHEQGQQPVILKVLKSDYPRPAQLARYRHEYEITRSLDAAGVIQVYGLEAYHQGLVLFLEDCGGGSLDRGLAEWQNAGTEAFPLAQFFRLAGQAAAGLAQVHQAGIIHKDINPSNIVFDPRSGKLKLIDFGLATTLSRETPLLASPQVLEGTLAYMSPEQTGRMNRTVDYRADFYSLGVTFYELLTGRRPFETTDAMELVHCHLAKTPAPPHLLNPAIPPVLSGIVLKLLAKAPEDRYQSARGLQYDLGRCEQFWQAGGSISVFELGRQDRARQFLIPEKLYGRAAEVETLLAAFERAAGGAAELMLVTGFSGIGKTAVINEVHKPMVRRRGYFIKGKFDQLSRNLPFAAFLQAFRDLIGQILGESEWQRQQWRSNILAALGQNGQVIIDVIPELEQVIGPQPPAPELSGAAAQNRFNLLFQRFIKVFAAPDHPLVIFLDDVQWADLVSLKLLHLLLSDPQAGYLLLLAAYRDNEVSGSHPLLLAIDELKQTGAALNTMTLAPLNQADIHQLIADSLKCPPDLALPLTQWAYQITRGNPFFNQQFLKELYEEGQITFNSEAGYWQCDLARAGALALADDVVEFMAAHLHKLPPETQEALKLAACLGSQFDLETLALVQQQPPGKTAAGLWPAVLEGLVLPQSQAGRFFLGSGNGPDVIARADWPVLTYRFLHDRVQQAAYSLLGPDRQQATHLQMGRLLLAHFSPAEQEERLFEIVHHLNMGRSLITAPPKRAELAKLNLRAGRKAKTATAYGAAVEYLAAGIDLLPLESWESHYDLSLALFQEMTEAAYLNTDFERMERWADLALQHARTLLDKVKIYETKLMATRAQGQSLAAIQVGLEVLQALGVKFPASPTPADIDQALWAARRLWQERPPLSLLDLPVMTDPARLAAMQILTSLNPSAYIAAPGLIPLLICKEIEFSVRYGNCPTSTFAYADYGMLLCGVAGDLEAGYEFGQLALKVLDRFQAVPYRCRAGLIVHHFITHWKEPLRQILPHLREAYQNGLATGDLDSAGFTAHVYCYYSYFAGKELAGLVDEMEAYRQTIRPLKQEVALKYLEIVQQAALNLQGATAVPWELTGTVYRAEQSLPLHQANRDRSALFHLYFNRTILCYLFGQYLPAAQQSALAEQYLDNVPAQLPNVLYVFYDALIHLALYDRAAAERREQMLERVQGCLAKMERWAALAPFNHQHRWELMEAERRRVLGQYAEAMDHYDRAITSARTYGYIQDEALANELAASFYLGWGKEKVARAYLQDAYDGYRRWGAAAKNEQLAQRYARLWTPGGDFFTQPGPAAGAHFDLVTVIKASQALAGEIDLARLLKQMMRLVLENAGAQRGALLLERGGDWVIEAQGDVDSPDIPVLQSLDLRASAAVSAEIVAHVARTRTSVVLADATSSGEFGHDPYLRQRRVKSVICAPLVNQGRLSGMVYLENNLTPRAFTAERLELLNLLSLQMALSLDNARLYQRAQQEIAERKLIEAALRESEQKFRSVVQNADAIIFILDQQGVFLLSEGKGLAKLGLRPDQVVGLSALELYREMPTLVDGVRRALANEQVRAVAEAHEMFFDTVYSPYYNLEGEQSGVIGIAIDITERKQVEAELRTSEARYRALVQSQIDLISRYRPDTTLTFVNEAYCKFYGKRPEELIGQSYLTMVAPEFHPQALKETENFVKDPRPISGEYLNYRWDGQECWIHWILQGIVDENGRLFEIQATGRDITPLKQAQEEIRRLNEQLEQRVIERTAQLAAANKELEAFSYTVSHDLRAPLRAIDGYTGILVEDYQDALDAEGRRVCAVIRNEAGRMSQLIDDLLAFSRLGRTTVQPTHIDMEQLVQSVFSELTTAESRQRLDFRRGDLPPAIGDPTLIRQVWVNLLANALKFSAKRDRAVIEAGSRQEAGETVYYVRDNGAGFDMCYAGKLFDVFQRLHSQDEFEGTGVGLAIVQRVIHRHGGRVWAEAEMDRGAIFYFTLPPPAGR